MERIPDLTDEENIPYAIGLPIEELIEPSQHTIYHYINTTSYQSQTQEAIQNLSHQQHQTNQDRELQETQINPTICQRIITSSIVIFSLVAISIYLLPP